MALKRATYTQPLTRHELRGERVGGRGARDEAAGREPGRGTRPSADLGGSSKYSNENFEGRSGEGFRVNITWSRVSRS